MQRCRGAEEKRCRFRGTDAVVMQDAEDRRGGEVQRCRGAEVQSAEVQRSSGAEVQRCRGAGAGVGEVLHL